MDTDELKPIPRRKNSTSRFAVNNPLNDDELASAVKELARGPREVFSGKAQTEGIATITIEDDVVCMGSTDFVKYVAMLHNSVPRLVYSIIELRKQLASKTTI